jgi:hypothetical protein
MLAGEEFYLSLECDSESTFETQLTIS